MTSTLLSLFPTFPSSTVKNADPIPQSAARNFSLWIRGGRGSSFRKRFAGDKAALTGCINGDSMGRRNLNTALAHTQNHSSLLSQEQARAEQIRFAWVEKKPKQNLLNFEKLKEALWKGGHPSTSDCSNHRGFLTTHCSCPLDFTSGHMTAHTRCEAALLWS